MTERQREESTEMEGDSRSVLSFVINPCSTSDAEKETASEKNEAAMRER